MVRSICGREVERVVPLTGGGMSETYRVELLHDMAVVVRIARQPVPWFTDEEHVMAQAPTSLDGVAVAGPRHHDPAVDPSPSLNGCRPPNPSTTRPRPPVTDRVLPSGDAARTSIWALKDGFTEAELAAAKSGTNP